MSTTIIETTPELARAARETAEHVDRRVLADFFRRAEAHETDLPELLVALILRLLDDLANGRTPVYASSAKEGVTPAKAAELLGVSRQFVDRMISAGRLRYSRKPNSTHRLIPLTEVDRLLRERERRRSGARRAVDALLEGGLDY